MSYCLQVWSYRKAQLPYCLPEKEMWIKAGRMWVRENSGWQVVVSESDNVEPEDIPAVVNMHDIQVKYLTDINLSPIVAGEYAYNYMREVSGFIADSCDGIIMDPQLCQVGKRKRLINYRTKSIDSNDARVLMLSWWFICGPLARGDISGIIDIMIEALPEALPRRYDIAEPPKYKYQEMGKEHFIQYVKDNIYDYVIWYPTPPIVHIDLAVPEQIVGTKSKFKCGNMTVQIDAAVLSESHWKKKIITVWHSLSHVITPLYGDIRILGGYKKERGKIESTYKSERHPVSVWWWAGIPKGPVHAMVLGEPYLTRWPEIEAISQREDRLAFITAKVDAIEENAYADVGEIPAEIAQVKPGSYREYPKDWPFGNIDKTG